MGQKESKQAVVVTIHLGSTCNSYAFKFLRKMGKVHLNPNWGSDVSFPFWMTPNCLLYNNDGTVDYFGIKAEREYFNQLEGAAGDSEKPVLFREFKKQLYTEKASRGTSFDPKMHLKSVDGKTDKPAVEVYADALKSLKEKALNQITHFCEWYPENGTVEENICWVVTMPDIWNKSWKAFLRDACSKAGMTKPDSKNLLFPLESQCASLLCRQLTWDKFIDLDQTDLPKFDTGAMYMIVNVADEKVTVSVHRIDQSHIDEVIEPIRATHDGKFMNRNLCDELSKTFGEEFIEHLKQTKPYLLWEIVREFSVAMKKYLKDQVLHIKIHLGFANAYKEFTKGKSLSEEMSSRTDGHIQLSVANGFAFSAAAVTEIIGRIGYDIGETVNNAMEKVKDAKGGSSVHYVFFVGEIIDWKIIQEELRNIEMLYKEQKTTFLIPPEAALGVLRGGVAYGQHSYKLKKKHWKESSK